METILKMVVVAFIFVFIFVCIYITIGWIKQGKVIKEKRKQWKKYDTFPLSVVEATIVTKQERSCLQTRAIRKSTTFISYRATFEFENGYFKEFSISLPEYNSIEEGDVVQLSLQGNRYVKLEKRRF